MGKIRKTSVKDAGRLRPWAYDHEAFKARQAERKLEAARKDSAVMERLSDPLTSRLVRESGVRMLTLEDGTLVPAPRGRLRDAMRTSAERRDGSPLTKPARGQRRATRRARSRAARIARRVNR